MPGFIAMKLCPDLVIIPPNFDKYRAVSEQVMLSCLRQHDQCEEGVRCLSQAPLHKKFDLAMSFIVFLCALP